METKGPRICCVGRRRVYPQRDGDEVVLELTLERGDQEQHLARLPFAPVEARRLHRALGTLVKSFGRRRQA